MRIGLTSIFVDDQDQAEQFYTPVRGFQVKTNAAYGPGERWLSVVVPEEPDGVELVLHLADEPARAFQRASWELGRPVISLRTDDCVAETERLTARGWCSSRNPQGWPTVAWMRSLPTPAATCSTSTRTDRPITVMPQLASASRLDLPHQGEPGHKSPQRGR
jgi:catechol 2,3-dioxygenase-like lactoylglutathione lyase family enzyme